MLPTIAKTYKIVHIHWLNVWDITDQHNVTKSIFYFLLFFVAVSSVTTKKSPNVYKSCPKIIDFDSFTKIA